MDFPSVFKKITKKKQPIATINECYWLLKEQLETIRLDRNICTQHYRLVSDNPQCFCADIEEDIFLQMIRT